MLWNLVHVELVTNWAAGLAAEAAAWGEAMAVGFVPILLPFFLISSGSCTAQRLRKSRMMTYEADVACSLAMQGIQLWQTLCPSCGIRKSEMTCAS